MQANHFSKASTTEAKINKYYDFFKLKLLFIHSVL